MKMQRKSKSGLPEYAKRIESERTRHSLTQKQLGEILHVGQRVVSCWERGIYPPSGESFTALGNLFRHDALWFYEQAGVDRRMLIAAALGPLMHFEIELKYGREHPEISARTKEGNALIENIHVAMVRTHDGGHALRASGPLEISTETAARILYLTPGEVLKLAKSGELQSRRVTPKGAPVFEMQSVLDHRSGHRTLKQKSREKAEEQRLMRGRAKKEKRT